MKSQSTAIYAGTFDPLTNGHFDVIKRAAKLFENLIVGIGINSKKQYFFPLPQRMELLHESCKELSNIQIDHFDGLAVDFALKHQAKTMVRGLRTEADYVYEMQMAMMNRTLAPNLETIFIPTSQDLSHISSSLVKNIASLGGDISSLVPPIVCHQMAEKLKKGNTS